MAWTDERLDDLANRMDAGFARIGGEIRELRLEIGVLRTETRTESRSLRTELKGDIAELRTELKGDIAELRAEVKGDIEALRAVMVRFGIAIVVCLVGMIATMGGAAVTGSIG